MQQSNQRVEAPARSYALLAILVLAYICSFLDRQILSLMIEPIKANLGINDFEVSLLQGLSFALLFATAGMIIGRLADRISRTFIIFTGILLWSLMTVLCGLSNGFLALFAARVGVGIGEAALAPAGYSLLADAFPPDKLVRAIAIFNLGGLLGASTAYFVGGALIQYLSGSPPPIVMGDLQPWQQAFVLIALPGFLIAPMLLLFKDPRSKRSLQGQVRLAEALRQTWAIRSNLFPLFAIATLLGLVNYCSWAWFPTHLIRNFGIPVGTVGTMLGLIQLVASIAGTVAGTSLTEFFQRSGRVDAPMRTIAFVSLGVALGLAAPLSPTIEITLAVWSLAVFCLAAYSGSLVATLQLLTPPHLRAFASAMMLTTQTILGLGIGTALIGGLADAAFPGRQWGIGVSLSIIGGISALLSMGVAINYRERIGDAVAAATNTTK